MGFFSDFATNLSDPNNQALMGFFGGMANGFGQAAMPSDRPIPLGAALSAGIGGGFKGATSGVQTAQQLRSGAADLAGKNIGNDLHLILENMRRKSLGMPELTMQDMQGNTASPLFGLPALGAGMSAPAATAQADKSSPPSVATSPDANNLRSALERVLTMKAWGIEPTEYERAKLYADTVPDGPDKVAAQRAIDKFLGTVRPATEAEKVAAGLDPKTPAQVDAVGKITPITDPNAITAYQQAQIDQNKNEFGETLRHHRATEANDGDARETWAQPVTEGGPDGKPIVVRYGSKGGRQIVDGATPKPQARNLGGRMIDALTKAGTAFENLDRLSTTFKDDFGGNIVLGDRENFIRRHKPGGDDTGQAQWWQDYQGYLNQVRNALFGAALTPSEQAEFEKAVITPRMSPEEIRKNIARQRQVTARAAQRQTNAYRASGYDQEAIEGALGYSIDELNRIATPLANPKKPALVTKAARDGAKAAPKTVRFEDLPSERKTIGGKTYVQIDGQWYEE